MSINIAMPVAHKADVANYASYYSGGQTYFRIREYFNRAGCQGLNLNLNLDISPLPLSELLDLYAFTDGYLSFQNNALVLRLPRELNANQYNSLNLFLNLTPIGPQLRHVVYAFSTPPGSAVEDKIRAILNDANHPGRTITSVMDTSGSTGTLQDYLIGGGSADDLVQSFMDGGIELFVKAGNAIGNFLNAAVDIRFLDSCGSFAPKAGASVAQPIQPNGRPLNPSYFLYIVHHSNATNVHMSTKFQTPPSDLDHTHPLDHLLSKASIIAANGNLDQILDVGAGHPPKPLHVTIDVKNAKGNKIAGKGIEIAALGDWHESRNNSNPYDTPAPVKWRNYGTLTGDTTFNDYCKFRTKVKPGKDNFLPGSSFDHEYKPTDDDRNIVRSYWERYSVVFNAVAEAFEIPCELLLTIACKETGKIEWFNDLREMNIIRMEPLNATPAAITDNAAHQVFLDIYLDLAGIVGGPYEGGANADIPIPWNGDAFVNASNLKWSQLLILIDNYPKNVRVSPGILQTLVEKALLEMNWAATIYGSSYINGISIIHNEVTITADKPMDNRGAIFSDWFGVAVNAAGENAAPYDQDLTRMKRALHGIIAGACYIKSRYNSVEEKFNKITKMSTKFNMITDFDLPTVASGYNDGADSLVPDKFQSPSTTNEDKWKLLFALSFYDEKYPKNATRYFNAIVEYFNTKFNDEPLEFPIPAVRLWRI